MPPARIRRTGRAINSLVQEKFGGPRAGGTSATATRRITRGPALGGSGKSPATSSCTGPGANLNALLDDQWRDPLSGNAVLGGMAITLRALV